MQLGGGAHVFEQRVDARREGVTMIGFDISSLKQAEHKLRDADVRKDEFLATLSHELRNPLTPLRLALDMLKLASGDPDKTDKARAIMDRQVDQLIGLVDEMLDLSRITQGKIEILRDPLDLRDVIAAAVEDTRGIRVASRHKLVLDLGDEPLNVVGESSRLVQVFVNLLTNAVKYTPVGGDITVTARRDPARGRLLVSVRDSGIGLAPEQLRDIFELFVQSRDARGRSRGGLGIGLNLVRRFVEMHGGNVTATSDGVGSGSTFVVDLPHAV
jgi:signal transduction histidine kinase